MPAAQSNGQQDANCNGSQYHRHCHQQRVPLTLGAHESPFPLSQGDGMSYHPPQVGHVAHMADSIGRYGGAARGVFPKNSWLGCVQPHQGEVDDLAVGHGIGACQIEGPIVFPGDVGAVIDDDNPVAALGPATGKGLVLRCF